jgi:hypothetical protein
MRVLLILIAASPAHRTCPLRNGLRAAMALLVLSLASCATPAPSPRWNQARGECQQEAMEKVPTNSNTLAYDAYIMGCMKQRGLDASHPE